jgi:hypothetical protein
MRSGAADPPRLPLQPFLRSGIVSARRDDPARRVGAGVGRRGGRATSDAAGARTLGTSLDSAHLRVPHKKSPRERSGRASAAPEQKQARAGGSERARPPCATRAKRPRRYARPLPFVRSTSELHAAREPLQHARAAVSRHHAPPSQGTFPPPRSPSGRFGPAECAPGRQRPVDDVGLPRYEGGFI